MLDFRIATFLKLCETKSYTNTAKLLHITQPSVTQHIKYLQKRYQCKLFSYEGKTLRLTPEGEYLRRHALEINQASTKVLEDLRRMGSRHRSLRFGCTKEFGDGLVPKIVGKMMETDENLELSLHIDNTAELVALLECGKLDFILTDKSFARNSFDTFDLARDQFCGWTSPQNAEHLYNHTLKRMFHERLLVREEGSGSRAILEQILDRRSCDLNDFYAVMLCNTQSSIKELTAAGVGISFCFASSMRDAVKKGKVQKIYLTDLSEERELVFMYLGTDACPEPFEVFFTRFRQLWEETMADTSNAD